MRKISKEKQPRKRKTYLSAKANRGCQDYSSGVELSVGVFGSWQWRCWVSEESDGRDSTGHLCFVVP